MGTTTSDDEQLLYRTIEDSRLDWQRYCDFVSDEQPLRKEAVHVDQQLRN